MRAAALDWVRTSGTSPIMQNSLPRRMPALDGLRGVAILLVVLTHVADGWRRALMITQDADWMAPLQLPHWLASICQDGAFGVTLFFVVSAFTLTVKADQRTDGWVAYATRRIARVGPGYWLAGLAYTLAAGLGPRLLAPQGVTPYDLAVAAIFGSAWQGGAALAVVPGGWSVSCEVAFYIALPVLLWVIQGRLIRAVLLTIAAALVAQKLGRYGITHGGLTSPRYFYPLIQAPVFLCGVTAAFVAQRVRLPHWPGLSLALLAFAIVALPFSPVKEWYLMHHLAFALVVATVVGISAQHPTRLLASRVMHRIGEVSYSIYLVHFALLTPCLTISEWAIPSDDWRTFVLHFTLTSTSSFVLACATYRRVELPCIQAAARWLETRQAPSQQIADGHPRPSHDQQRA